MMAKGTVNKVILLGKLGKDPEVRATVLGISIANISLATTDRVKQGGEWTDKTEWHQVVLIGKIAEIAGNHLRKGYPVYIEGRLQTRKWEDKQGNTRYTTEVLAQDMQMLGTGNTQDPVKPNNDDDDMPF